MADAAELAMKQVSDSSMLLGGNAVTPVRGDSTCTEASAATAPPHRTLVGANCCPRF